MQATANLHHQVTHAVFPEPDRILDDPTALDAANDVLDQDAPFGDLLVGCLLLGRQFATFGLLEWSRVNHASERIAHKAQIIEQFAPRWQGVRCGVGNRFVVDTPKSVFRK